MSKKNKYSVNPDTNEVIDTDTGEIVTDTEVIEMVTEQIIQETHNDYMNPEDIKVVVPEKFAEYVEPEYITLSEIGNSIEGLYLGVFPMQWFGQETPMLLFKTKEGKLHYCRGAYQLLKFIVTNNIEANTYLVITRTATVEIGKNQFMAKYSFKYDAAKKLNNIASLLQASALAETKLLPETVLNPFANKKSLD